MMTWTNKNRQMTYPSVIAINVKKFARNYGFQKQSSRGVLKICSKFTREHPMRKWGLNKFIEITLRYECSPVNLLNIFRTPFPRKTYGGLPLRFVDIYAEIT